jgi:hypothetical protein
MSEIKPPVREIMGSPYMDDNWMSGRIDLINGQVIEYELMRYDVLADQIEVKIEGRLNGVKGQNVKSLTLFNEATQTKVELVSGRNFHEKGVEHTGLLKVVTSGEWSLLEKTEVKLVEPSYNPVLGVGEVYPKHVKSSTLFIARDSSIVVVPKSKKRFIESFNEQSGVVADYMKEENLSPKEIADVKLIVDFLNKKV